MVRASSSRKFTEQKRFTPHCCWMRTHIPFAKVCWKNTVCPTLWEWYVRPVANTKVYWKNMVCPTLLRMVRTSLTRKFTENTVCPTLLRMVRTLLTRKRPKQEKNSSNPRLWATCNPMSSRGHTQLYQEGWILFLKLKGARGYLKPYKLQFCIVSCTQATCKLHLYADYNRSSILYLQP